MRLWLQRFWYCALTILVCSQISVADELEDAKSAYHQKDYAAAVKEFTALAEKGSPEAQLILGKMYMLGQGVSKDSDQAIKWYKAAAEQGDGDAQFFLGSMYLLPQRDIAEGVKWLLRSAEQGMQDAQLLIGMAYLKGGKELPRDLVQADRWLQLAAMQGGDFYQGQCDAAEKQMTPDQIAKAKALAAAWKPKVAPGLAR
jgi:TPR repeat protein